jgi:hypothetical protein
MAKKKSTKKVSKNMTKKNTKVVKLKKEPVIGTPEHIKQWLENENKLKEIREAEQHEAEKNRTEVEGNNFKSLVSKNENIKQLGNKPLTFDRITGELIIADSNISNNDNSVVVDQIYKDGFFNNEDRVFLKCA